MAETASSPYTHTHADVGSLSKPKWSYVTLQDRGIETLTGHTSFVSDDDSLVLEDESARMALKGNAIAAGPVPRRVADASFWARQPRRR